MQRALSLAAFLKHDHPFSIIDYGVTLPANKRSRLLGRGFGSFSIRNGV